MIEVLLFVNIGLLVLGSVTFTVAIFALMRARRYVELAEERMESLRETQAHLLAALRAQRRVPEQEPAQVGQENVRVGTESTTQEDAAQRIDELQRELGELQGAKQGVKVVERKRLSQAGGNSTGPGRVAEKTSPEPPERETRMPQTAKPSEKSSSKPDNGSKNGMERRGVWHHHPDDDVGGEEEPAAPKRSRDSSPVEMFRDHYDRYLDNYEGYVKLARRIVRAQDEDLMPGSPAQHEGSEKLRRIKDGIQRTTSRLDILEQYNPELATDERISRRANIARSYSEIEEKLTHPENI